MYVYPKGVYPSDNMESRCKAREEVQGRFKIGAH